MHAKPRACATAVSFRHALLLPDAFARAARFRPPQSPGELVAPDLRRLSIACRRRPCLRLVPVEHRGDNPVLPLSCGAGSVLGADARAADGRPPLLGRCNWRGRRLASSSYLKGTPTVSRQSRCALGEAILKVAASARRYATRCCRLTYASIPLRTPSSISVKCRVGVLESSELHQEFRSIGQVEREAAPVILPPVDCLGAFAERERFGKRPEHPRLRGQITQGDRSRKNRQSLPPL